MRWCTNYLETWFNNRGKKWTLCWWYMHRHGTINEIWIKNELGHTCGWSYLRSKFGRWLSSPNSNKKLKLCRTFSPPPCWRHITTLCPGVFIKSIAKGTITTKIFGICVVGHYGVVMVVRVQLWIIFTQHITILMHQTIFKYFFWQLVDVQRFVFITIVTYFPPQ
jgi:hypothetical protein